SSIEVGTRTGPTACRSGSRGHGESAGLRRTRGLACLLRLPAERGSAAELVDEPFQASAEAVQFDQHPRANQGRRGLGLFEHLLELVEELPQVAGGRLQVL